VCSKFHLQENFERTIPLLSGRYRLSLLEIIARRRKYMAATTIKVAKLWNWRRIAYSVLAGLFGLQFAIVGLVGIAPYPWQPPDPATPWITKWHSAHSAMLVGVLCGILLLATLFRPQKKVGLIQLFAWELFVGIVIQLLRIPYTGFDPSVLVNDIPMVILIALFPAARQRWSLKGEGPRSKPLLILTGITAILLLPDVWRNLQWQITGFGGDPAWRYLWLEAICFIITLIAAGYLTAIKRPGWQVLGLLLSVVYLYIGVVAVTLPGEIGSWGTVGGILSILVGAAYLLIIVWEIQKAAPLGSKGIG
jgi:hypothetical protein